MPEEITGNEDDKNILEFAQIGAICAIPADEKSPDTVNFVEIVVHCINDSDDQITTDDWGQIIAPGQVFIEGRYCLHQFSSRYESKYTQRPEESVLFQGKHRVSLYSTC